LGPICLVPKNPSIDIGRERFAFDGAFRIPLQDPSPHEASELVVRRDFWFEPVNHFSQRRVLDWLAIQIQLVLGEGEIVVRPTIEQGEIRV
jgi:hypothetical protein